MASHLFAGRSAVDIFVWRLVRDHFFSKPHIDKISWILSLGASIGIIISAFFLPGGDDLYRYYIPFENGCLDCGYVPYYAQWFLWPLHILPDYPYAWPAWTIINVLGFLALAHFTGVNPFVFMISFPVLGQFWLGQVDISISLGIVIFLFARNPYTRGLGICLALTKPQLTVLPIFFSLLLENPKSVAKLMVIPSFGLLISLLIYGPQWPIDWVSNALDDLPVHVWRLASMDVWKFGMFLVPAPLLIRNRRTRLEAGLLVSALATPFFGVYSYVTFLLLNTKWWTCALSYGWVIGYFWLGESAMRFAWILPLFMLLMLVYEAWNERHTKKSA
jgi:hypothetical protein